MARRSHRQAYTSFPEVAAEVGNKLSGVRSNDHREGQRGGHGRMIYWFGCYCQCQICQHAKSSIRQAYAEYGITQYKIDDCEVDHLIPLSLGGSNSIRNLWPQSTKTSPWNSYVKDALERKLHKLVCAGQLDLETAKSDIASNWIEAYQKYLGKSPPAPRVRETKPSPATSTASEVWVNTRSGKYWKPGSRFYGKTKEGEFMWELEARKRGYSPAGGTGQ